jgi:hypothetical protein
VCDFGPSSLPQKFRFLAQRPLLTETLFEFACDYFTARTQHLVLPWLFQRRDRCTYCRLHEIECFGDSSNVLTFCNRSENAQLIKCDAIRSPCDARCPFVAGVWSSVGNRSRYANR